YDMSIGYNLVLAEKAIIKYQNATPSNINDVIELYHIKKLLDNNCRLTTWDDDYLNQLKVQVKDYNGIIAKFFKAISVEQIEVIYESIEWGYRQTFWDIIDQFKMFNIISADVLKRIAQENANDFRTILKCGFIVEKFKGIIRDILLSKSDSAHIIIDKYIARHNSPSDRELFLPSNLTMEDKEYIISRYLESDSPNLNYVRLICQNKDEQKNLILSPLIKVKANKLAEKLNDELMNDERTVIVEQKVGIEFSNIEGIKPCSFKMENDIPKYTYSVRFIKQCDNVQLIANSCYLFNWMNRHFLLELINKNSEVDVLESIAFDMSKNAYPAFNYFLTKNRISLCQLCGYNDILTGMQTSVEQELKKLYEVHLKDKYNYPSLVLNFPNVTDSWLNKCRVLLPELDSVVKQYNTYVEYDEVDIDIIKYSKPLKVTEGKSLLINKYFEINKDNIDISRVLYNMFASGAMLNYVEPYKDKHYHCLYDLLSNENSVSYNNYEDDQKHEIDFLVNQNILKKDDNGLLSLFNIEQMIALQSLWEYHACAYWHYNTEGRNALDEMFTKGWVVKKDNLLTTEERKYFSYCLDNSEFTNGLAYRNHYAHGSTPPKDNENIHQTAYFTILKLLTILILKIEDDLWSAS
ncbi:hypothetical protein NCY84_19325, partial [Phocaeicola vulgatus]